MTSHYSLLDALDSLTKAIEEDDKYAVCYEELGHYYDSVEDKPVLAESHFRKAIALGGSAGAYAGLARVLAEQGRVHEVEPLLKNSPFSGTTEIVEVLEEIAEGIWHPTSAKTDPKEGRSDL